MDKYDILKKYFGYTGFRKGQEFLVDSILAGRDVLGIMPTGAGKSLCYQVPALLLPGVTVVVSPLISLMKDQVQALNQAGVHAAYINSSLSEGQIAKALSFAANGRYKIIYVAPERLETPGFLSFAEKAELSLLTVDEAHCISQWGQDFRPSYLKIVQFIKRLAKRPVVGAFTATATGRVKEDIACVLGLVSPQVLVTGFDRENLYFGVEYPAKKDTYVMDYVLGHSGESGIIYCATRKNVEAVHAMLSVSGINATKYHAGLDNETRRQNQEDFMYDKCPVMVATNAFGMGIDKSNIRYVIHYNMPQGMENYYQEAGRAGRDGVASECILLYSAQDAVLLRYMMENKEPNVEFTAEEALAVAERDMERLRAMEGYCKTKNCLREYILDYFGEYGSGRCGNCSNCKKEFEETDVTEAAVKVVECVRQMRGRYGLRVVAGTLSGENTAKLKEYRVSEYPAFASLKEWSQGELRELIGQMLLEGYLDQTKDKYALLGETKKARGLFLGECRLIFKRCKKDSAGDGRKGAAVDKRSRSDILNSRGLTLFDLLRQLRMEIAREESVPPYIIFSDKTLLELCVRLPFNGEEMQKVAGIGENKYARYGERFLGTINDFTGGKREKLYFGDEGEALPASLRGGSRRETKKEFSLTKEQAEKFPYREAYLEAELAAALNELRNAGLIKKISGAEIFRFMEAQGYVKKKRVDGLWKKVVSGEGIAAGLYVGLRKSKTGTEYEDVYYGRKIQRLIVDHYMV